MFGDVDKDRMRLVLRSIGADLIREEYDQRRVVFDLPSPDPKKWIRVRDEGVRVTLSYKEGGTTLVEQQEAEVTVSDYETAIDIVSRIGCSIRSVQESKREEWEYQGVQITLDTWPHLSTLIEIEGNTEESIIKVSKLLALDYEKGIFGTVNHLYKARYGRWIEELPDKRLAFDGPNPFELLKSSNIVPK